MYHRNIIQMIYYRKISEWTSCQNYWKLYFYNYSILKYVWDLGQPGVTTNKAKVCLSLKLLLNVRLNILPLTYSWYKKKKRYYKLFTKEILFTIEIHWIWD